MTCWPDRSDDFRSSDMWSRACGVEDGWYIILLQKVQLRFHCDSCNRKPASKGVVDVLLKVRQLGAILAITGI